jgi:hypothetical protein
MPGYSHASRSNQERLHADRLEVDSDGSDGDTLVISLSPYMPEDGQACLATDLGRKMSKAWPRSEITHTPGKISLHIPEVGISVKDYRDLPKTVEGSIGALKVDHTSDKDGIDLTFANTPRNQEDIKTHRYQTYITAYTNTEVYETGRNPNQKLGFGYSKQGDLDDKFTAECGNVSQTANKRHGYVATSFVPASNFVPASSFAPSSHRSVYQGGEEQ